MKNLVNRILLGTGILLVLSIAMPGATSEQITMPLAPTETSLNEVIEETPRSVGYQTAYAQGRREAEDSIAQGKPTLYIVGKPSGATVDEQTGLPLVAIAGCRVDDSILGRRDGYNQRVQQWVAQQAATTSQTVD